MILFRLSLLFLREEEKIFIDGSRNDEWNGHVWFTHSFILEKMYR